jgi:hypothetical protein
MEALDVHVPVRTSQQHHKCAVIRPAAVYWHSAGNVWKVGQNNDTSHWYTFIWRNVHRPAANLLRLWNSLIKTLGNNYLKEREKIKGKVIVRGENEGYIDLNKKKKPSLYEINNKAPLHEAIVGNIRKLFFKIRIYRCKIHFALIQTCHSLTP